MKLKTMPATLLANIKQVFILLYSNQPIKKPSSLKTQFSQRKALKSNCFNGLDSCICFVSHSFTSAEFKSI